jgi:multimeric flavodoxin WrbA
MKITAFNGSPWGTDSNTQIIVEHFLKGADDAGAKTQTILLQQYDIKPCKGCFDCMVKTPGKCSVKDDMAGLIKKFMASDVVIFATPLHLDNITGLMKVFMDRLIQLVDPHFEKAPDGQYRHKARYNAYPKIAAISNGNMPEQSHFEVLRLMFSRLARWLHTELVAEIYRGAGGLLRSQEAAFRPIVNQYLQLVQKAGFELAKNGKVSQQTAFELDQPLIDPDQYAEYANKQWDKLLSKP